MLTNTQKVTRQALRSSHEEVNRPLSLHALYTAHKYQSYVVVADETDKYGHYLPRCDERNY